MDKLYLRPGVLFWKDGNNHYIYDQLALEGICTNGTGYALLKLMDSTRTKDEIIAQFIDDYKITKECQEKVHSEIEAYIKELEEKNYIVKGDLKKEYNQYMSNNTDDAGYAPGLVYWEVTVACNSNCIMCYNPPKSPHMDELTLEEGIEFIDYLGSIGTKNVIFTGGEPLVRANDVIKWVAHCTKRGIHTEIFSNGILITQDIARRLKEAGLGYCRISIHGSDAQMHDSITQRPGAFDAATNGMQLLIAEGIPVAWSFVANTENFCQVRKAVEKAISLKCHGFMLGSVDLIGYGSTRAKNLVLSPDQEGALWNFLDEAIYVFGDKIRLSWGADLCKDEAWDYYILNPQRVRTEWKKDINRYMRYEKNSLCGVGIRSCGITAKGNITLCPATYDISLGNIREDKLLDVWENAPEFKVFRDRILNEYDHCGECGMRYACVGGCRANAFHQQDSLTGRDMRRCKVHCAREKGELKTLPSFFTKEELINDKFKLTENQYDAMFASIESEGRGPWIPYTGVQLRATKNELFLNHDKEQ